MWSSILIKKSYVLVFVFIEEWIIGHDIPNLGVLEEMIVGDQIKRRLTKELKEHFLIILPKLKMLMW